MKKLIPLYAVIFTGYIGISMIIILFTTMIMNESETILSQAVTFKERSYLLGAVVSMYPLGQFFGLPLLGSLSDHFGRKRVLVVSLFLSSILFFTVGIGIQIVNFYIILSALFILGLSEGNVVIAQSVISEQTQDKKERIKRFGMISVLGSLSFVVGPLVVAHFTILNWSFHWNFSFPFFMIGTLIFLLFILISIFFHYPVPEKREGSYSPRFALVSLMNHPHILVIYLGNFFLYLAIAGLFRLYPIFLVEKFSLNTFELSRALALNGVGIIAANTIIAPRLKNFKSASIMIIFSILASATIFSIITMKSIYATFFMTFLAATFMGTCNIYALETISREAPRETLGEILGNNSSVNTLSQVLIGFLGSYLMTINQNGSIVASSLLALVAAMIYFKILRRSSSQQ